MQWLQLIWLRFGRKPEIWKYWYLKETNLVSSAPLTNDAFTASPDVVVLWNSFQLTSNTNAASTQFVSDGIGAHGGLVIVVRSSRSLSLWSLVFYFRDLVWERVISEVRREKEYNKYYPYLKNMRININTLSVYKKVRVSLQYPKLDLAIFDKQKSWVSLS